MSLKFKIVGFFVLLIIVWQCTVTASFSEGKIYGTTFAIGQFPNNAALVQPSFSQALIDGLRTKIINESNLKYSEDCYSSTYYYSGSIANYTVTPLAATGANTAASNRLTVSVNIKCDTVCPVKGEKPPFINKTYTEFADYGNDETFAVAEERLIKEIVTKISQQAYLDLLSASTAKNEKDE